MAFTELLTDSAKQRAWRKLVNEHVLPYGPLVGLTKPDLVAAADAVQAYLWANRAAINTALPEPFKSAATQDQKLALLAIVALANLEG